MPIPTEPNGSIPRLERLGACVDCGFSPFGDGISTPRDTEFATVQARVGGTRLAAEGVGV